MISRTVKVENAVGLHARPATFFIQKANSYVSSILIECDGGKVNAKSLLGVLSLGVGKDSEITLTANGTDENEAVEGLVALIEAGLSE